MPVPTPHILPPESRGLEGPFLSFMAPNLGAWFSHTCRRALVIDDLETPLQFWKSEETKFIMSSCAVSVKGIMNASNFKRHIVRKIMWKVSYHLLCQIRRRNRCWERLGAGGEGDDPGRDGWMASRTRWTWVWVNSGRCWWTGRPGVPRFMGSQRVEHDWATELNWTVLRM